MHVPGKYETEMDSVHFIDSASPPSDPGLFFSPSTKKRGNLELGLGSGELGAGGHGDENVV